MYELLLASVSRKDSSRQLAERYFTFDQKKYLRVGGWRRDSRKVSQLSNVIGLFQLSTK